MNDNTPDVERSSASLDSDALAPAGNGRCSSVENAPVGGSDDAAHSLSFSESRRLSELSAGARRASGGSSGGRKLSYAKKHCFTEVTGDDGSPADKCMGCGKMYRNQQRSATSMSRHAYGCNGFSREVRARVYADSVALQNEARKILDRHLEVGGELSTSVSGVVRSRPASFSAESPVTKVRRRPQDFQGAAEDAELLTSTLLSAFIQNAWSFTAFDSEDENTNWFYKLLKIGIPWYAEKCFPSRRAVTGKNLDQKHEAVAAKVDSLLRSSLSSFYGTVIFDGWEDETSACVVNVLLRTEGNSSSERRTLFLDSIYTSHEKVGADAYVRIVEEVMKKYGGMDRIYGVTSDSAQCCKNAKDHLTEKYPGLVGVQDQAHVANLAMQDIGSIGWVRPVLDKVSFITNATKSKRKLYSRLKEAIKDYNKALGPLPPAPIVQDPNSLDSSVLFPALRSTAVMLKRPAKTRFASIESTLESFIRTRPVLMRVVQSADFLSNLWEASNEEERFKRDEEYVSYIESRSFLAKIEDLHKVFRLMRRYLREFDSDEGMISDVIPKTTLLAVQLRSIPTSTFLTQSRKDEVIAKYMRRQDGPLQGQGGTLKVRLLEPVHFAAYVLDPYQCPMDVSPFLLMLRQYLCTYTASRVSGNGVSAAEQRRTLFRQFVELHGKWRIDKLDPTSASIFDDFKGMPLLYWSTCVQRSKYSELITFARRTLSISPSSCAAERSFSMQSRIRTRARNRLDTEKVRKLAFAHWNMRLIASQSLEAPSFFSSVLNKEEEEEFLDEQEATESGDESVIDLVDVAGDVTLPGPSSYSP